jgi:hypothetical protein
MDQKYFRYFFPLSAETWPSLIAGAGRVGFMRRAVEKIEAALAGCSDPTVKDVQAITEAELLDFYETHH